MESIDNISEMNNFTITLLYYVYNNILSYKQGHRGHQVVCGQTLSGVRQFIFKIIFSYGCIRFLSILYIFFDFAFTFFGWTCAYSICMGPENFLNF